MRKGDSRPPGFGPPQAGSLSSGETIIHEGDFSDRFYLIEKGQLEVSAANRHVATLGRPYDHVGEIALLQDVLRTATIVARDHDRRSTPRVPALGGADSC